MCALSGEHTTLALGLKFLSSSSQNVCGSVLVLILQEATEAHTELNQITDLRGQLHRGKLWMLPSFQSTVWIILFSKIF